MVGHIIHNCQPQRATARGTQHDTFGSAHLLFNAFVSVRADRLFQCHITASRGFKQIQNGQGTKA